MEETKQVYCGSKRTHEESIKTHNEESKTMEDDTELISYIENGKLELERIMIGLKDPNKLSDVRKYLDGKSSDLSHLTVEVRTLERMFYKKKDDGYHYVFKIHLNSANIPAYFYLVNNNKNIIEEREVYILKNVN